MVKHDYGTTAATLDENPREAEAMLELGGTVLGLIVAMVLIVRLFSSVFQLLD